MAERILATWSVTLHCECPHCKEFVDLLEHPDFWDGQNFEIAEHGTEKTENVTVWCPKCVEEFLVTLEY